MQNTALIQVNDTAVPIITNNPGGRPITLPDTLRIIKKDSVVAPKDTIISLIDPIVVPIDTVLTVEKQDGEIFTYPTPEGIQMSFKVISAEKKTVCVNVSGELWGRSIPTSTRGSITIPANVLGFTVEQIAKNAFKDCSGLTSITIPESVNSIEEYAFEGCI